MTGKTKRIKKWVSTLLAELTTGAVRTRSANLTASKPVLLPSAASHSPILRQEVLVRPAAVVAVPKRRRIPLPSDNPQTKRAARTVDKSKVVVACLFEDVRLGRPVSIKQLIPIVTQLATEVECNSTALLEVLRLKNKREYTYLHSVSVSTMMLLLGRAMGYAGAELSELGMAGLLHDIGKVHVPARILDKPDRLTDIEFASVKAHPTLGYEILLKMNDLPEVARSVCRMHHEKIDGSGYPLGLTKDRICVAARMGAICDVYDALTSDRAYKSAWSPDKTLRSMRESPGHFDQDILAIFMQALGIYPVGSLVSVRGSNLGIVLRENSRAPTKPIVRTFYSIARKCRVSCEDVSIGAEGILAIQDPSEWAFTDWEALSVSLMAGDARLGM